MPLNQKIQHLYNYLSTEQYTLDELNQKIYSIPVEEYELKDDC